MAVNFNHINNTITAVSGSGLLNNIGSGAATYQLFNSSSTWTKPSGAVGIYVECVGGGGGGGGGAFININTDPTRYATGGGGGLGGGFISRSFVASSISSPVTITVGAGGAGGSNGSTSVTSNGVSGANGGVSSFGTYATTHPALGGTNGITAATDPGTSRPTIVPYYFGNSTIIPKGLYSNTNSGFTTQPVSFVSRGGISAFGPGNGGAGGGTSVISSGYGSSNYGLDGGLGFAEQQANMSFFAIGTTSESVGGGLNGTETLGSGVHVAGLGGGSGTQPGCGGGGGEGSAGFVGAFGGNGAYPGGGGGGAGAGAWGVTGYPLNCSGGIGGNGYVLVVTW